eukprot:11215510-Lingulodinium_polyedra.AAC.1
MLRVLDHVFEEVLLVGFEGCLSSDTVAPLPLAERPLLLLPYDEGGPDLALSLSVQNAQGLRCLGIRDAFH